VLRRSPILLVAISIALTVAGCGGGSEPSPRTAIGTGSGAAVPTTPGALSRRLRAADRTLRAGVERWRARPRRAGAAPLARVRAAAIDIDGVVERLSRRPRLVAATTTHLPPRLASAVSDLTMARRDLRALSAGWPDRHVRTGPPAPLDELMRSYRVAERRFGIGWPYLAAINFVESAFGRVRSRSVAGARGPMQFMPATWRAYGLGGNIDDPGDAILGAANLLRHSGAPRSYRRALRAYNPSTLYVDAVSRYARTIRRDPGGLYLLYSWPAG
jgi:soluble lytic murein transglycosylase-like protein